MVERSEPHTSLVVMTPQRLIWRGVLGKITGAITSGLLIPSSSPVHWKTGIQLSRLKAAFGSNAFATTKTNAANGVGNTDPNRAYLQQPAVRLTPEAASWLSDQFEVAAAKHGRLRRGDLLDLDWPPVPA